MPGEARRSDLLTGSSSVPFSLAPPVPGWHAPGVDPRRVDPVVTPSRDRSDPAPDNPFGIFPIIVLVVLIVGGLMVAFRMRDVSNIQDCVSSGRKNCAPIDPANP
jgi:hypothetical protein